MRRPLLTLLIAVLALLTLNTSALADDYELVYRAPDILKVHPDSTGFQTFLTGTTRAQDVPTDFFDLVPDGSDLIIVHRSTRSVDAYLDCFEWELTGGGEPVTGHTCDGLLDEEKRIIDVAPADRLATATAFKIDVYRLPKDAAEGWSGGGRPPETITHASTSYGVLERSAAEARVAQFYTLERVTQAVNDGAKNILRCAHPTGRYNDVYINSFSHKDDGMTMRFTIDYQCRLTNRPCALSIEADYASTGEMHDLRVIEDTARTNPELGLKACEAVLGLLRR